MTDMTDLQFQVASRILAQPTAVDSATAMGAAQSIIETVARRHVVGTAAQDVAKAAARVYAAKGYSNTEGHINAAVDAVLNLLIGVKEEAPKSHAVGR